MPTESKSQYFNFTVKFELKEKVLKPGIINVSDTSIILA